MQQPVKTHSKIPKVTVIKKNSESINDEDHISWNDSVFMPGLKSGLD